MLQVSDLSVSYGAISALSGISFKIEQGSIVTLIGGNGAGKTTTLRTISGLLRAKSGTVTFLGENISALAPHKIVARGLCHVPEGRMIFSNLTVDENLSMGAYLQTDAALIAKNRDYVFSIFPRLKERIKQTAGTLSGGEQQMLAIGRALMGNPKFLMLDEPSLGIAPRSSAPSLRRSWRLTKTTASRFSSSSRTPTSPSRSRSHAFVLETGRGRPAGVPSRNNPSSAPIRSSRPPTSAACENLPVALSFPT
jgi:branched-chain amino acid transport system ATP-binding protein